MPAVIVLGMRKLALELVTAAEQVLGRQQGVYALGLQPGDTEDNLRRELELLVRNCPGPVLILVDSRQGVCGQVAADFTNRAKVVYGANLPMLMAVLKSRSELSFIQLLELAVSAGKEGILMAKSSTSPWG